MKLYEISDNSFIDSLIINSEFDENDIDAGTAGLCGTFALSLADVLGTNKFGLLVPNNKNSEPIKDGNDWLWNHVVVLHDSKLYDIEGEVRLADIISNYCWNNPNKTGCSLIPVDRKELEQIIKSDNKSFDSRYYYKWFKQLKSTYDKF